MRSTLYLKFIIVYIIFGFLGFFTIATLTSGLTEGRLETYMSGTMYKEANLVASDYLPDYFSKRLTASDVHLQLKGMESHLNASVWFVDRDGNVLVSAQSDNYPMAPGQIEDFDPAEGGSSQYQVGEYHDCFAEDVITVIAPVVYNYTPNGYLIIHKRMSDIMEIRDLLLNSVYISMVVIYALSFIILLAFQFFVYRPLRKITEAATQYASGNLDPAEYGG